MNFAFIGVVIFFIILLYYKGVTPSFLRSPQEECYQATVAVEQSRLSEIGVNAVRNQNKYTSSTLKAAQEWHKVACKDKSKSELNHEKTEVKPGKLIIPNSNSSSRD